MAQEALQSQQNEKRVRDAAYQEQQRVLKLKDHLRRVYVQKKTCIKNTESNKNYNRKLTQSRMNHYPEKWCSCSITKHKNIVAQQLKHDPTMNESYIECESQINKKFEYACFSYYHTTCVESWLKKAEVDIDTYTCVCCTDYEKDLNWFQSHYTTLIEEIQKEIENAIEIEQEAPVNVSNDTQST